MQTSVPPLSKVYKSFDGPQPSASPYLPALVPVAGKCAKHDKPLFKLASSKTVAACDGGCLFSITSDGLVPQGGV